MGKRIKCIVTLDDETKHIERIVGVHTVDGGIHTTEAMARAVTANPQAFYVERGGHRAYVQSYERDGRVFIRTEADHTGVDNLLALPEC
jgi:hypothetical protein